MKALLTFMFSLALCLLGSGVNAVCQKTGKQPLLLRSASVVKNQANWLRFKNPARLSKKRTILERKEMFEYQAALLLISDSGRSTQNNERKRNILNKCVQSLDHAVRQHRSLSTFEKIKKRICPKGDAFALQAMALDP